MSHNRPTLETISADDRYLTQQPLPGSLLRALSKRERVYVGAKPYRVKATGISEDGRIIGKLEAIDVLETN